MSFYSSVQGRLWPRASEAWHGVVPGRWLGRASGLSGPKVEELTDHHPSCTFLITMHLGKLKRQRACFLAVAPGCPGCPGQKCLHLGSLAVCSPRLLWVRRALSSLPEHCSSSGSSPGAGVL